MVAVKEVRIGSTSYFYLLHTIDDSKRKEFRRFLGKSKPEGTELEAAKQAFLEDISNKRVHEYKHPEKNVVDLKVFKKRMAIFPKMNCSRYPKSLAFPEQTSLVSLPFILSSN